MRKKESSSKVAQVGGGMPFGQALLEDGSDHRKSLNEELTVGLGFKSHRNSL